MSSLKAISQLLDGLETCHKTDRDHLALTPSPTNVLFVGENVDNYGRPLKTVRVLIIPFLE